MTGRLPLVCLNISFLLWSRIQLCWVWTWATINWMLRLEEPLTTCLITTTPLLTLNLASIISLWTRCVLSRRNWSATTKFTQRTDWENGESANKWAAKTSNWHLYIWNNWLPKNKREWKRRTRSTGQGKSMPSGRSTLKRHQKRRSSWFFS